MKDFTPRHKLILALIGLIYFLFIIITIVRIYQMKNGLVPTNPQMWGDILKVLLGATIGLVASDSTDSKNKIK